MLVQPVSRRPPRPIKPKTEKAPAVTSTSARAPGLPRDSREIIKGQLSPRGAVDGPVPLKPAVVTAEVEVPAVHFISESPDVSVAEIAEADVAAAPRFDESEFMTHLNENATLIQRWFRARMPLVLVIRTRKTKEALRRRVLERNKKERVAARAIGVWYLAQCERRRAEEEAQRQALFQDRRARFSQHKMEERLKDDKQKGEEEAARLRKEEAARMERLSKISELKKRREARMVEEEARAKEESRTVKTRWGGVVPEKEVKAGKVMEQSVRRSLPASRSTDRLKEARRAAAIVIQRQVRKRLLAKAPLDETCCPVMGQSFIVNGIETAVETDAKTWPEEPAEVDDGLPECYASPRPVRRSLACTDAGSVRASTRSEAASMRASTRSAPRRSVAWAEDVNASADQNSASRPASPSPSSSSSSRRARSVAASQERLQDFMQYLDSAATTNEEEQDDVVIVDPNTSNLLDYLQQAEGAVPSPHGEPTTPRAQGVDGPSSSLAVSLYDGVKAKMEALKTELAERIKTTELLKSQLKHERETAKELEKKFANQEKAKLEGQKREYESAIERHLSFIDRLLADKNELSQKCGEAVEEAKAAERRYHERAKEMEEAHRKDVEKQKEAWRVAEKIRRDTWMQEKEKEIKQSTVKGLEPEINKLLAKHRNEKRRMEDAFNDQLREVREDILKECDDNMMELRRRLDREREVSMAKEREAALARMRDMEASHAQQLQSVTMRWENEVDIEKERLELKFTKRIQLLEDDVGRANASAEERIKEATRMHQEQTEAQDRRHANEMKDIQSRVEIERDQWQKNLADKLQRDFEAKERSMKERLAKERDAEFDVVISRLNDELLDTKRKVREEKDAAIARLKEDHKAEMARLRDNERHWVDKYTAFVQQKDELEASAQRSQSKVKRLEREVDDRVNDIRNLEHALSEAKLEVEHAEKRAQIRHADETLALKEDLERARKETENARFQLESAAARHEHELQELRNKKASEYEQVSSRVKQTIEKKDELIGQIKEQVRLKDAKIRQMQELLQKQREELLG